MNKKLLALPGILFLLLTGTLHAQFYLGPSISGGMTYGKNFITPDTSQYYIANSPSIYASGGLDLLYQFDENIRAHVGVAYSYKRFNLQAPDGREGLSFTSITRNATAISIPMTLHYRIPMGEGGKTYFNIIAGHSLDFTSDDTTIIKTPSTMVDSGQGWVYHEYNNIKRTVPTVLLGLGADIQSKSGHILNISAVWGISTGKIFDGNIQEWTVLNQDFDPNNAEQPLPEEFPEHYFDWALRGSTLSLRASYWFDLGNLFGGGGDDAEKEGKPEKEAKPEKVKKEKPAKDDETGN